MSKRAVNFKKSLERLTESLNQERTTKMDTFFEVEEVQESTPKKKYSFLIKISNNTKGLLIRKAELLFQKIPSKGKIGGSRTNLCLIRAIPNHIIEGT